MENQESEIPMDESTLDLPAIPHLEPEALSVFDHYVSNAACYLEYGAGGSTVRAAQRGARYIITVDSSRKWIDAVRAHVGAFGRIELVYCDIGEVGPWGRPRDQKGLHGYFAYMSMPWQIARGQALEPTVILVDGRFRVACFLYSLLCAQGGTIILFDDYVNRDHYHVVEQFSRPHEYYGRMAVFEVNKSFSLPDIVSKIAEYSIISD